MTSKFWWKDKDGTFRLVDRSEFEAAMGALPDHSNGAVVHTPPPPTTPGLGDVIAGATKAVGIKPCGKCQQRQAALNRATPSYVRRVLAWLRAVPVPQLRLSRRPSARPGHASPRREASPG
jgi:hypothetical protein